MAKTLVYYRRLFYTASLFNGISFNFIIGNIMMLFLSYLQASDTNKGFVSALAWFSLICIVLGKVIVKKIGIVKTMGIIWISRSLAILPLPIICWFVKEGLISNYGAVLLTILTQIIFQFLRGVGIAGNNPLFFSLTDRSNRARFLAMLQVFGNTALILVLFFSSLLFLLMPHILDAYATFFFLATLLGVVTGILYLQQQEPKTQAEQRQDETIFTTFKILYRVRNQRNFIYLFLLHSLASSALGGFLIIFMKENSSFSNAELVSYALGGPISIVVLGLLLAPLLDRIGPKPFIQIYTIPLIFICLATLIQPLLPSHLLPEFYILLFIFNSIGNIGVYDSLQTYFLNNIYTKGHTLNLGLIIQLIRGIGGLGLLFGGIVLDLMKSFSFSVFAQYNVFFALCLIVLLITLVLAQRLEDDEKTFNVKRTLKVLFSPREWQGLWLLSNLNRPSSASKEHAILERIQRSRAQHLVTPDYFLRLNSPDFLVREEVLQGLQYMELEPYMFQQLIQHIQHSPFTTAAKAAALLGKKQVSEAIPQLRKSLSSTDYNLQAEAALALARLGDDKSLPALRTLLLKSTNLRIVIYTINAIKILSRVEEDEKTMLDVWGKWEQVVQVDREITLALAALLGHKDSFSPCYFDFCIQKSSSWVKLWRLFFEKQKDASLFTLKEQEKLTSSDIYKNFNGKYLETLRAKLMPLQNSIHYKEHPYWASESGLLLLLSLCNTLLKKKKN